MTPLRQRFIDDLRLKNFSEGTIKVYVQVVEKFARFLGRSTQPFFGHVSHLRDGVDVETFLSHSIDNGSEQ